MQTVTIIGAGNVGTTLGMLFASHGHAIHEIYSRTRSSAERAQQLIGSGRVMATMESLTPADLVLISTSDDSLAAIADDFIQTALPRTGTTFFHCSGSMPASILAPLQKYGCHVASVHPVKSFAAPQIDAAAFAGTWCGIEGDEVAICLLRPIFEAFGAKTFPIDGRKKLTYHAATVFISNYCVSLIEVGLRCYEEAGVPRSIAAQVIQPLVRETIANALRLGPVRALTGPIARGDVGIVRTELAILERFGPQYQKLYRILGSVATELSAKKGVATAAQLAAIRDALHHE